MFHKSLIAAAVAGVMAIGLSAAPANAWHRHNGGIIITFGHGHFYGHHHGHKHKHCHAVKVKKKNGKKIWVKKCHSHWHHNGHH